MTDDADELPPTVAAHHPETTFVPPVGDPAVDLAWSLGDDADTVLFHRHSWDSAWGRALLMAGCAIAIALFISIGCLIVMLAHRDTRSAASAPEHETVVVQTSVVTQPAPPSTTTVTVEALPTTVTLPPTPTTVTVRVPVTPTAPTRSLKGLTPSRVDSANDQQFLDRMRSLGYTITDPRLALRNAHETCRLFQSGESSEQVNQQMSAKMGTNMNDTLEFTSSAVLSYPDCFRRTSHAYGDGDGD
jgi:hypothetical protein